VIHHQCENARLGSNSIQIQAWESGSHLKREQESPIIYSCIIFSHGTIRRSRLGTRMSWRGIEDSEGHEEARLLSALIPFAEIMRHGSAAIERSSSAVMMCVRKGGVTCVDSLPSLIPVNCMRKFRYKATPVRSSNSGHTRQRRQRPEP
jgi:hypothetical protein